MDIFKEKKVKFDTAIAYFLGWRINNSYPDKDRVWTKGNGVELDTTFKFSSDWNVLNEVVEAIEKLGYNFHIHQARVLIDINDEGLINGIEDPEIEIRSSIVDFNKKMAVYYAVAKFALWYNELQIKKNAKQNT